MENAPYMNEAVASVTKKLRERAGYTQEQLAGFAKTSRSQIAQLEAGSRGVTLSSLYWLADSLNIKFSDLLMLIEQERGALQNESSHR